MADAGVASQPLRVDLLTIFPEIFDGFLRHGILSRAIRQGLVEVNAHDLRSFTHDRHRTVDDRPFGGGEGMVLKPEPIFAAAASLEIPPLERRAATQTTVILLSAQGAPFTQAVARQLSGLQRLVLVCGRYEGVDERVAEALCDRELSIGDYVLSGGELAAAVVLDATVRLLPGVLGNADSARYESFGGERRADENDEGTPLAVADSGGLLDYPHYTRPAEFEGMPVPEVLLGGDHAAIRQWRREQALRKTLRNRPELLQSAALSESDRKFLARLRD